MSDAPTTPATGGSYAIGEDGTWTQTEAPTRQDVEVASSEPTLSASDASGDVVVTPAADETGADTTTADAAGGETVEGEPAGRVQSRSWRTPAGASDPQT